MLVTGGSIFDGLLVCPGWSENPNPCTITRGSEHCGGTPNFLTGMGSYLQSVIQGWGGVRYNVVPDAMTLLPEAPRDNTTNLTLSGLHFKSTSVTLSILQTHAVLSHAHGDAPSVAYIPRGAAAKVTVTLEPGQTVSTALGGTIVVKIVPKQSHFYK